MGNVQLVRLDATVEDAVANHPEFMEALVQDDWVRVAAIVHGLVGRTLVAVPISVDKLQWGGYFVVDPGTREVVGTCAFKTPPIEDGTVEIAYFTYPGFEGRGYATGMARKLIELASGSAAVRRVVAHTLPETNASTRVLEKAGMNFVGEVIDPEDGRVWRWQVQIGA
jgi:[ribosomal protein S5]-alanine N-acetyltransferase